MCYFDWPNVAEATCRGCPLGGCRMCITWWIDTDQPYALPLRAAPLQVSNAPVQPCPLPLPKAVDLTSPPPPTETQQIQLHTSENDASNIPSNLRQKGHLWSNTNLWEIPLPMRKLQNTSQNKATKVVAILDPSKLPNLLVHIDCNFQLYIMYIHNNIIQVCIYICHKQDFATITFEPRCLFSKDLDQPYSAPSSNAWLARPPPGGTRWAPASYKYGYNPRK